jgi:hypothetical protein
MTPDIDRDMKGAPEGGTTSTAGHIDRGRVNMDHDWRDISA